MLVRGLDRAAGESKRVKGEVVIKKGPRPGILGATVGD